MESRRQDWITEPRWTERNRYRGRRGGQGGEGGLGNGRIRGTARRQNENRNRKKGDV